MTWEALSASATTLAVVIALWPLFETWRNRRATAVNIRAKLFLYFMALRPSVARRFMETPLGPQTDEPLSGKDLELLQAIEALIPCGGRESLDQSQALPKVDIINAFLPLSRFQFVPAA